MSVTEQDKERAEKVVRAEWLNAVDTNAITDYGSQDSVHAAMDHMADAIAAALAEEREQAIEPFTALADEMGRQVEFRRAGDQELAPVADVRETDLRWLRLAISNARDPR